MGRKTTFKRTVFAHAVLLAIAATVSTGAMAQSNATGNIFGQATPGATVVIENTGTGAKRTLTLDSSGRFQATSLPPGSYKVNLLKGSTVSSTRNVEVLIGQGAEVKFADGSQLATVEVVGQRKTIDVSSTNNGASFTAKQLEQLPIAKDLGAIIQLAPNTTRGDFRYNGAASMGGAAPSENAFYINGFPATNPLNQLGSSTLPFGAIGQTQVLTGGFGAEFGRSTGGVVNITTKSGTNTWEAGVNMSWTPDSLRGRQQDIRYSVTGDPANALTDGTLYRRRADNTLDEYSVGAYIGGPLVQDKLFMFLAMESLRANSGQVALPTSSIATGDVANFGWSNRNDESNRYLAKFDWNLTDDHRLELTLIGDKSTRKDSLSGYNYTTLSQTGATNFVGNYTNVSGQTPVGMNDQILKYTGNLTDDLTITALYGKAQSPHANAFQNNLATSGSTALVTLLTPTAAAPGIKYTNPQPLTANSLPDGAQDDVTSARIDLEYRIGKHSLRAGLDNNKLSSTKAGDFYPGIAWYRYQYTATPTKTKVGGVTVASGGALGTQGYYARERIFTDVTDAYSDQSAQYIEDRYQVTKDVMLSFGLRNESFANKNPDGDIFLEQKNVLSPRFGAAWDVNGDSSLKVFGSLGRYSVQIPTHLAVRGAGPSTYLQQYFTYSGIAADGSPIGRVNLGPQVSPDNEYGQKKDYRTLAATDLKPNQQDEITLGFEKAFSPELNFGAKVTYRKMLATIDDFCDQTPIDNYAAKMGINTDNYGGFSCASVNPGLTNTLMVDYSGTGKNLTAVTMTPQDMGFDPGQAQRTYFAVDLFLEHPLKNGWYGKVNYTYSRNEGSTEGQTLSDIGQTDVAATQAWDFPQLMEGAYGRLPNDRTHQLKAYGYYNLNSEWAIGANLLVATGRPRSCIGSYAGTNPAGDPGYGSATHYCNGVLSPRGSLGNLPTDTRLDMNFVYKPEKVKGLALKVDIFNLINQQTIQAVDEVYNTGAAGTPVISTYERVLSYTAPRSVKLSMSYDYKF